MNDKFDISAIEAMILAAPEPLPARKIVDVLEDVTPKMISEAIDEINSRYSEVGTSFRIRKIAGGYQFYIIPEFTGYVEELFARQRKLRLTRAALESMAIIAYRQPVTKTEIEHIRGVASDGVIHNLMEKKMIAITGRSESVGRALQYGSTDEFLKFFGINSLKDLPQMKEIEEILKAEESRDQTELNLENAEEEFVKLNIADGSFAAESDEVETVTTPDETETTVEPENASSSEVSEDESVTDQVEELVETNEEVEQEPVVELESAEISDEADVEQPANETDTTTDDDEQSRVIVDMDAT